VAEHHFSHFIFFSPKREKRYSIAFATKVSRDANSNTNRNHPERHEIESVQKVDALDAETITRIKNDQSINTNPADENRNGQQDKSRKTHPS